MTSVVGATLKFGSGAESRSCSATASTSKYRATSSGLDDDTYRPHMKPTLGQPSSHGLPVPSVRTGRDRARTDQTSAPLP